MIYQNESGSWCRICPECNKEILHTGKYSKYVTKKHDKNKRMCNSCSQSGKNHPNFGKSSWSKGLTKETDDRILKMSESVRKSITPKLIETNRLSHLGKIHSIKTKKLWSKQRQGKNNAMFGKRHNEITRKKISEVIKNNWKSGLYKFIFKSKGQLEIIDILNKLGYNIVGEYYVKGKPFDIFIKDKNLLIEFNGTYWHCDSRIYDENYYHTKQKMTAKELWNRDNKKQKLAVEDGYKVKVIWQKDWERCNNKIQYLTKIVN